MKTEVIYKKASQNKGLIKTSELKTRSEYNALRKGVRLNEFTKIKNGTYVLNENALDVEYRFDEIIPGSVLCLWSAWNYYGLSDCYPENGICVAVKRGRKVHVPVYPEFEIHHLSEHIFDLGVTEEEIDGIKFKIYDKERCVCDAVKHRYKIGLDTTAEIIRNYVRGEDSHDYSKIFNYAKKLHVEKYLKIILNYDLC